MMEKCNGEAQRTDAALQKRHGMFQRLQIKQERDQTRRESNATKQFKQNGKVWRASYEKAKSSEDRAKKKKFHNQKENARAKRSKILKCLQRTNACKDWKKKITNRKADAHNENEEIKPREYHIHVSTNPSTWDLMKTTKANQIRKATKTSRNIQLLKRRYFSCHHPKKKKIKMTKYEQDQREGSNDRQTTGQTGEILPFSNRIRAHGLLYPVPCSDRWEMTEEKCIRTKSNDEWKTNRRRNRKREAEI